MCTMASRLHRRQRDVYTSRALTRSRVPRVSNADKKVGGRKTQTSPFATHFVPRRKDKNDGLPLFLHFQWRPLTSKGPLGLSIMGLLPLSPKCFFFSSALSHILRKVSHVENLRVVALLEGVMRGWTFSSSTFSRCCCCCWCWWQRLCSWWRGQSPWTHLLTHQRCLKAQLW